MTIKIKCIHCNDFYENIPGEALRFLNFRLENNGSFLKELPYPPKAKKNFNTLRGFMLAFLEAHCPYCRSVLFDDSTSLQSTTLKELKESGFSFQVIKYRENDESWILPPGEKRQNGPIKIIFPKSKRK
jgi:hypothetical protein